MGVIYAQGRPAPGRFADEDRERAELFAARLAMVSGRLLAGVEATKLDDDLRWFSHRAARSALTRHDGNVSRAANQLGITRSRLYRILALQARR